MITGHKTTDAWLAKQAIWNDNDMWKAFALGIAVGCLIGLAWGYDIGSPDLSRIISTGVKG